MGCYEQPAITAITPVMAAPITLSGDKHVSHTVTHVHVVGIGTVHYTAHPEQVHVSVKAIAAR